MSRSVAIPFFPTPPETYSRRYTADVTRAFALYAQQMNVPGPWRATELTLTQEDGPVSQGQLSWNTDSETVDITMGDDVVQQVGFETFMRVRNNTGATIENGSVVGFAGVGGEIDISKYTASPSANELYFIGVTTRDMPDNDVGPVTLYGKVRGLDTTGQGAETWSAGDILYASTSTAGGLTNVRPTAPNPVISIAAVLTVDATDGEIMVRPVIPMGLSYGSFDSTTSQTAASTNTAYTVTMQNTMSANGVSIGTPTSRIVVDNAGFYNVSVSLQLTSGNSSTKTVYMWLRKNGTDLEDTTRAISIDINSGSSPLSTAYNLSLEASDYIELCWATDNTGLSLSAITGLAFAPDAPSAQVTVTQTQL